MAKTSNSSDRPFTVKSKKWGIREVENFIEAGCADIVFISGIEEDCLSIGRYHVTFAEGYLDIATLRFIIRMTTQIFSKKFCSEKKFHTGMLLADILKKPMDLVKIKLVETYDYDTTGAADTGLWGYDDEHGTRPVYFYYEITDCNAPDITIPAKFAMQER